MSVKRFFVLLGLCLCVALPVRAQVGDIYASVTQNLTDKVLSDVQYPFTVVNMWDTFHPPSDTMHSGFASKQDVTNLLKWAEANDKKSTLAHEIVVRRAEVFAELDLIEKCRALAEQSHTQFSGPTKQELDKLRKAEDWDTTFFLAHFRSDILKKPSLQLAGKVTTLKGLSTDSEAIGEWWVKRPKAQCIGNCQIGSLITCCQWEAIWVWEKWTASINDFKLDIDATVTADVDSSDFLYLSGQFDKLRIPIPPILDKIPIEAIVNPIIAGKHFNVLDINALVATVPYVNLNYGIKALRISGTHELRIDIDVIKKP